MTKLTSHGHSDLKMVNPTAAAIDIGSTMHMAAVNPEACDTPIRAFGTFTQCQSACKTNPVSASKIDPSLCVEIRAGADGTDHVVKADPALIGVMHGS